jgi:hypothetical protein
MSGVVKRLICRLFGHRKVEKCVFVIDVGCYPSVRGVFGSNLPDNVTVGWLKAMYGDFGHVEKYTFCERCGRWWKP